jgi:hypothetical protein
MHHAIRLMMNIFHDDSAFGEIGCGFGQLDPGVTDVGHTISEWILHIGGTLDD